MNERLKLARVRWFLGQSLLPEHLWANEQSLVAEGHVRSWLHGLPDYGVARLRWNDELLADGVLSLSALTVLLRDAALIDVPRSAAIAPLTLAMTGGARVPVFVHLLDQTESAAGNPLYTDDPAIVQRVVRRAQLTTSEKFERSIGSLKLAEFEKTVSGKWVLSSHYIPPLLNVAETPFLTAALNAIKEQLSELEPKLVAQLQDTFLRLERLAVTRTTLSAIYQLTSLLSDLQYGVGRHPYELFAALRTFYFTLCCFHEVIPEHSCLPYNHADSSASFAQMFAMLGPRLKLGAANHNHMKFVLHSGLFGASSLPDSVKTAQEVYLLIQRANIHERINIEDVKLSATSRLALVHRMVLNGIPFKALERVHFQHSFGPEVDFYQLTLNEEWALGVREGSVAFYQTAALEKAQAFLFWR